MPFCSPFCHLSLRKAYLLKSRRKKLSSVVAVAVLPRDLGADFWVPKGTNKLLYIVIPT